MTHGTSFASTTGEQEEAKGRRVRWSADIQVEHRHEIGGRALTVLSRGTKETCGMSTVMVDSLGRRGKMESHLSRTSLRA